MQECLRVRRSAARAIGVGLVGLVGLVGIGMAIGPAWAVDISGGGGNDHLVGSEASDTISGLGGDDVLEGRGGADWLWGNDGDDQLDGGAGNDVLTGGRGSDVLVGGEGADVFELGDGKDSVYAGAGNDYIKNLHVDPGPHWTDEGDLVWSAPDHIDCGPGYDTVDASTLDTYDTFVSCEQIL